MYYLKPGLSGGIHLSEAEAKWRDSSGISICN